MTSDILIVSLLRYIQPLFHVHVFYTFCKTSHGIGLSIIYQLASNFSKSIEREAVMENTKTYFKTGIYFYWKKRLHYKNVIEFFTFFRFLNCRHFLLFCFLQFVTNLYFLLQSFTNSRQLLTSCLAWRIILSSFFILIFGTQEVTLETRVSQEISLSVTHSS